jgi:CheY-like chemotaxis protein
VLEAQNGAEALLLCERFSGDIQRRISDVVIPRMSGHEIAERLTEMRPRMKVLYVSGYTDDIIVRHGVLDVGVSFLEKPITPDALARKVREALDDDSPTPSAPSGQPTTRLAFGETARHGRSLPFSPPPRPASREGFDRSCTKALRSTGTTESLKMPKSQPDSLGSAVAFLE